MAAPGRELCRIRWAALIKRVFEVDPLRCPNCGGAMKTISFIKRVLRHCNLWGRPASRAPPHTEPQQLDLELQYVDTAEFLMAL